MAVGAGKSKRTKAGGKLPDPLTPPDCDLRGIEPPWDLFVDLAVVDHGADRQEAQLFVNQMRRDWQARR